MSYEDEYLCAVDPGASGGFAFDSGNGIAVCKMPSTSIDLLRFCNMLAAKGVTKVLVEKVGFHRQGNSASSSAKFAWSCGELRMALLAAGLAIEEVTPSAWMKGLLGDVPKEKTVRKNKIKQVVQMRYPRLQVTLATSDALGMLTYWKERRK